MTNEQASDWEYRMICCLGISTSNSDINVVGLHKTVKELYEQGRADEREAQVCCGDYEKCMKACTPRGRWLAEKELAKPEQEPVAWMVLTQDDKKLMLWGQEKPPIFDAPVKLIPLYTAPPRKTWVGLTQEERDELLNGSTRIPSRLIDWVEQKLKEKNT